MLFVSNRFLRLHRPSLAKENSQQELGKKTSLDPTEQESYQSFTNTNTSQSSSANYLRGDGGGSVHNLA
jgi:hypothetical protein